MGGIGSIGLAWQLTMDVVPRESSVAAHLASEAAVVPLLLDANSSMGLEQEGARRSIDEPDPSFSRGSGQLQGCRVREAGLRWSEIWDEGLGAHGRSSALHTVVILVFRIVSKPDPLDQPPISNHADRCCSLWPRQALRGPRELMMSLPPYSGLRSTWAGDGRAETA